MLEVLPPNLLLSKIKLLPNLLRIWRRLFREERILLKTFP
jgi:hypothetical protein